MSSKRAKCTRWQDKIIGYISLVHDCIGGVSSKREQSVLDGRTKLLVMITLVHDCFGGKCRQIESKVY